MENQVAVRLTPGGAFCEKNDEIRPMVTIRKALKCVKYRANWFGHFEDVGYGITLICNRTQWFHFLGHPVSG